MFIFVKRVRSSVVVTPVEYERDNIHVTSVFIILKKENNQTETIVYVGYIY